jgi:TP901 family phage tail tape measure protein
MMFGGGAIGGGMIGTGIVFALKDAFSQTADRIKGKWKDLDNVTQQATMKMERSLNRIKMGFAGLAIAAVLVAPFALGVKTALKLEDQLADVMKTTNMTADQAERLKDALFAMDTRTSIEDLLTIATIGGQVGVATEKIEDFTKAVDKVTVALGDEFSGGAEEVAKTMGMLRNSFADIRTENIDQDIMHIANAINELGASGFATGPVVSDFANRIGGIGIPLGLTSGQVLGLSATLQELGVNAERGGTAISRVFAKMLNNTQDFAKIAGMDVKKFEDLLRTDLFGAFQEVVKGSKGMDSVNLSQMLDQLGLDGIGTTEVFLKLSSQMGMLQEKTDMATDALKGQSSILKEFNTKNNTTAALVEKLKTKFTQFKDVMGRALFPVLKPVINLLMQMFDVVIAIAKSPFGKAIMAATLALAGLIAGLSTFAIVGGTASRISAQCAISFAAMGKSQIAASFANNGMVGGVKALTKSLMTMNPYIIAAAAVVGIYVGAFFLAKKAMKEFKEIMEGTREPVDGIRGAFQKWGAVIYSVIELFKSATLEGFSMSKKHADALKKMGIYEFVVALGTWIVRIKALLGGIWEGLEEVFSAISQAVIWLVDQLDKVANAFGFDISKNLSDMKLWIQVGKVLGIVIGVILVAALALIIIQMAILVLALLPIIIIVGLIIAVIYYWGDIMDWIGEKVNQVIEWITDLFWSYVDFMFGLPGMFVQWGVQLVNSMWQGIVSSWGWLKKQFLQLIRDLPGGGILLDFFGVGGDSSQPTGSGTGGGGVSTPVPTNGAADNGGLMQTIGQQNAQKTAGGAGGKIVHTKETKEINKTTTIMLDGRQLKMWMDEQNENDQNRD